MRYGLWSPFGTFIIITVLSLSMTVSMITEIGGSHLLYATSSILLMVSSTFSTPIISPSSDTPKIICPPSVLAKPTIDFAKSSLSVILSLNSVCKSSPYYIPPYFSALLLKASSPPSMILFTCSLMLSLSIEPISTI